MRSRHPGNRSGHPCGNQSGSRSGGRSDNGSRNGGGPRGIPPASLKLVSAVAMSLLAGTAAWAKEVPPTAPEVEFNDEFLRHFGGTQVDIRRFNKGNVVLPGTYRADLLVNGVPLGRAEVPLKQLGDDAASVQPCFDLQLVERLGIDIVRLSPEALARLQAAAGACAPLPELVPDATARFDGGEQKLEMSIPQAMLTRRARGYVDPRYWDEGVTAARLQYTGSVYYSDARGAASSTQGYVGLNAGFNIDAWRLRHVGNLSHSTANGTHYQSVQTNLARTIVPLRSQLVMGHGFTDGALFDSFGFRGAQMASDDRMLPESQRGYAPTVRGIANSNARVQIRQNGNIIYETNVSAGAFEINDIYPTGYGGDLDVVVTEADGSVHVTRVPYASAVLALRPGVTRYSVTAGQYRSPNVQDPPYLMQATVQHGFSNLFTGYAGAIGAEHYASALLGVALNTDFGAFGTDVTYARASLPNRPDKHGESVRISYSKLIAPTNTNLAIAAYRYSSSGYLSLPDAVNQRTVILNNSIAGDLPTQRGRLQLSLNQALPRGFGSVYFSGSTQSYWNRSGSDTQFLAGYNNSWKQFGYSLSATRQFNATVGRWENRFMISVTVPLGNGPRAPYSTTSLQADTRGQFGIQESVSGTLGEDNAFTYGVTASHQSGGDFGTDNNIGASASYITPMATVSANASKGNQFSQVGADISGGVVAWSGGVAFSPLMAETVGIVEAADAAGARVLNGSGLRVDPWGHAVVGTLTPFARNEIELDPKGLPVSVSLKSTTQTVAPTAGAVVRVRFETDNSGRAAVLRVTTPAGKPLPFGAEVFDTEGNSVGTVGQGSRIVARALKVDTGRLTVKWGDGAGQQCSLQYALPPLEKMPKDRRIATGDATCTTSQGGQPALPETPVAPGLRATQQQQAVQTKEHS